MNNIFRTHCTFHSALVDWFAHEAQILPTVKHFYVRLFNGEGQLTHQNASSLTHTHTGACAQTHRQTIINTHNNAATQTYKLTHNIYLCKSSKRHVFHRHDMKVAHVSYAPLCFT